ncbi:conserved Plasmodium protein, unknown function [Plasmodium gallinaceum]|uniref:Uncharacterized protein n=1 Tax=Plasmodium gallinaceum TaxID=5849 RepID=A0A1J1GZY4_PLAGA|nr:conserved Plasmodium protein, unknown function [Plasmodium gallinaceum]CRG98182.1 conserved Plasmodium protein, unknown function [Plasmodium gallinaceum]
MNLFCDENNENNYIHCDMIKSMNEKGKEKLRKLLKVNDNIIYDDVIHLNIFIKNIWVSMNLKCHFSIHDLVLIARSFKNTEIIYDTSFNENLDDSLYTEKKKNNCIIYFQPYKIRKNVVKIYFQKPYVVCFIHKNGSIHIHGSLTLRNILLILIKVVKKIKYKTFWYYLNQNKNIKEQNSYSESCRDKYKLKESKNFNSESIHNIDLNEHNNEKKVIRENVNNENLSSEYFNDKLVFNQDLYDEFLTDETSYENLSEHKISNINNEDIVTGNIINNDIKKCNDNIYDLNSSNPNMNETDVFDRINLCENIIKEIKQKFSNYEFYLKDNFLKNNTSEKIKVLKDNHNLVNKYNIKNSRSNNKNTNRLVIKKNIKKFSNKNNISNYSENDKINENNELLTKELINSEEFSSDKGSEIQQLHYNDCIINSKKKKKKKKNDTNFLDIEKDTIYLNFEKQNWEKKNKIHAQNDAKINDVCFNKNEKLIKENKIININESNNLHANNYSKVSQKLYSKKDIYKFDRFQKWRYKVRDDITFDMNYFNIKQFVCVFKIRLKYFDITKIYKYKEFKNILTDINNIIYIKIDQNLLNKLIEQNNLEKNIKNNSLENYKKNNKSSVKTALLFSSGNIVIYACKNKREVLCISRFIINTLKRNNNIIL